MLAEIRAQFGEKVADIVLGCSDSLVEDPAEKRPWLERKEAYVAHVAEASPRCAWCRPPTSCTTSAA